MHPTSLLDPDPKKSVESSDVIKLILQFLKEQHLTKTLKALQEETSVSLNTVDSVPKLTSDIIHGKWDSVLEQLSTVKVSAKLQEDLFEQVVLELAEIHDTDTAKELLEKTQVLKHMKDSNPNRYLRLQNICNKKYFDPLDVYPVGSSKETQRQKIASALKREVMTVPPSRLLSLVSQALKWQQYLGKLPAGTQYDLFAGDKPREKDRVERLPKKNKAVIHILGSETHATYARFSPNGQFLVSGSQDGFIEVWDFDTGKLLKDLKYQADGELMMHASAITCLGFSRDSELLASGSRDGKMKIWTLFTGDKRFQFDVAHGDAITSVEFSQDGTQVLSCSLDSTIRIHGLRSKRMLKEFEGHKSFVNKAIYSSDGSQVISCSSDGTVKIWNLKSTHMIKTFKPNPNKNQEIAVRSVQLRPGTPDQILVCNASNTAYICNLSGKVEKEFSTPESKDAGSKNFVEINVSSKGNFIYALGDDKILYCFEVASSKLVHAMKLHSDEVLGIAHHPQRDILASWSTDHLIKIWRP